MRTKLSKRIPQIIYQGNEPVSVIVNINDYIEILERLEDIEDLKILNEMKKKTLKFKKLNDFLKDYSP